MGTITVRPPRAEDKWPLVDVHVKARRSYYEGHVPEAELAEWERSARATGYVFDKPDRIWLCAELDQVFAGFALVTPAGDLLQLQVAPRCWGRGVGHSLHEAAMDALRDLGVTTARLHVFAENHRARRFYTDHGWRETGRDGDHVRMALELRV
ncbi:ribosomal protein S18 acetylase RimI-like enzyme [Saccharothrix saharensis]|uniref:Ribosomal protein S18 acetylase RimI-like enzyme n=1 Tax=Saccharothrix saharensis TaxID=571190 RepID=A0A543JCP5_9PSEU|nr:GNAT family N-acetyltransferase [Saccharothrix saharensis]TQM80536.1 ribosomal protein S18 acetylase RimI-like enzyme [Saccharothrix saharensis]